MSKESRLKQARKDKQIAIEAADKKIESLLAEIEAEKKSGLRCGDYGNKEGAKFVVINIDWPMVEFRWFDGCCSRHHLR